MRTTATNDQMTRALAAVNEKYAGNIIFNRYEPRGRQIHFTLRCKSSKGPGHSLGFHRTSRGNRRRLTACCWHVHGDFFDALLAINPDAVIYSLARKITKDGGNWQDWNAGSMMDPLPASEKCECNQAERTRAQESGSWAGLNDVKVREIRQSSLTEECWGIQIWGPGKCETCEFKDTDECGGQEIRRKLKNKKGLTVPVDYTPDSSNNN